MIGKDLGHYHIHAVLGEGGMGVVYEAEDTRLKRRVALKVLSDRLTQDSHLLERFQREAEALAALNHPNIVTVYSVEQVDGIPFLTMELVTGKQLDQLIPRGGLDLEAFFDLALPLTEALTTAHELGITHRDLKPANIVQGEDGRLRVLDFGLAKFEIEAPKDDKTVALKDPVTAEGTILGTAPYMSPEQLEGKAVDARSDIFSLGILMYEMLTGERPFKGDSSMAVMSAVMKDQPTQISELRTALPRHLDRIVGSCLEKDPENREQTAKGVRNSLRSLQKELSLEQSSAGHSATSGVKPPGSGGSGKKIAGIAAAVVVVAALGWFALKGGGGGEPGTVEQTPTVEAQDDRQMIVVLPFENLGASEDEYFADGLTEEITSRLASIKGLGVISRTSAMQYKDKRLPLKEIGEQLGVDYVLEGTVRWAKQPGGASRVRVTPQLIRVSDDTHLWSSRYDQVLEEIFAVQSEIAEAVAGELNITLLEPEKEAIAAQPTQNMEAYQLYLKGNEIWSRPGYEIDNFRTAARIMEQVISMDPEFVVAYARLTNINDMLYQGGDEGEDILDKAQGYMDRALALDPDNKEVRLSHGYHLYLGYFDYEGALAILEPLQREYPNEYRAHEAIGYIKRRQGKIEEAVERFQTALKLDPYNAHIHFNLARTLNSLWRFEESDRYFRRSQILDPEGIETYIEMAFNHLMWKDDLPGARDILALCPNQEEYRVVQSRAYFEFIDRKYEPVLEILNGLEAGDFPAPHDLAQNYMFKGQVLEELGRQEEADQFYVKGLPILQTQAEERPGFAYGWLGEARFLALLGRHEEALTALETGSPIAEEDQYFGKAHALAAASFVYLKVGREQEAVAALEAHLFFPGMSRPNRVILQLDPIYDPIRDTDGFQDLLQRAGPES